MSCKSLFQCGVCVFFLQAEDGIRDAQESRGLGDVYKRQGEMMSLPAKKPAKPCLFLTWPYTPIWSWNL